MIGPIPRYSITSSSKPSPSQQTYNPAVRTTSPIVPLTPAQIHLYFAACRQIPTRRDSGPPSHQHTELAALVAAHTYALTLNSPAPGYRDALVDATAEYLDDHSLAHFPWTDLYANMSGSSTMLLGVVCLYWSFTADPMAALGPRMASEEAEERFLKARRLLRATGKTGKEMWEEYMRDGRCRFHEHEGGGCWWDGMREDAEEETVRDEREDETVEDEYEDSDATIEEADQDKDERQEGKRDSKCEEYRDSWEKSPLREEPS